MKYDPRDFRNHHPIFRRDYDVLTSVIKDAYGIIREYVLLRRTGLFLYARPRTGKTRCANITKHLLNLEFENCQVVRFSADLRGQAKNDSAIVIDILESESQFIPKRSSYRELMTKLIIYIKTRLDSLEGDQFVLMIDEMQMLSEQDFRVLMVLHNKLELIGIKMTTIGFAQPEILERRSAMFVTKSHNLIARFLSEPIRFEGCCSKSDLKFILNAYDCDKVYPEGSGCTYTAFFLPEAYENGFRLASHTSVIWGALEDAASEIIEGGVPMEHTTMTIENILIRSNSLDGPGYSLSKKMVDDSVAHSSLKAFSGLMSS